MDIQASKLNTRLFQRVPSGKILYCIAFNRRLKSGRWVPDTLYLHATDDGDARLQFFQSEVSPGVRMDVVGIAPVVGFFANDDNGDSIEA